MFFTPDREESPEMEFAPKAFSEKEGDSTDRPGALSLLTNTLVQGAEGPGDQRLGLTLSGAGGAASSQSVRVLRPLCLVTEEWLGREEALSLVGPIGEDGARGDGLNYPISNPMRT